MNNWWVEDLQHVNCEEPSNSFRHQRNVISKLKKNGEHPSCVNQAYIAYLCHEKALIVALVMNNGFYIRNPMFVNKVIDLSELPDSRYSSADMIYDKYHINKPCYDLM